MNTSLTCICPSTSPQEKLRLDMDDEAAIEWMQQLLNESATALMPQIMETTHKVGKLPAMATVHLSRGFPPSSARAPLWFCFGSAACSRCYSRRAAVGAILAMTRREAAVASIGGLAISSASIIGDLHAVHRVLAAKCGPLLLLTDCVQKLGLQIDLADLSTCRVTWGCRVTNLLHVSTTLSSDQRNANFEGCSFSGRLLHDSPGSRHPRCSEGSSL